MRILLLTAAVAASQLLATHALAQAAGTEDKAAARAERKVEGAAAARGPQIGEGQPIPDAKPKASSQSRSAAKASRKATGAEAARGEQIGEGDPMPDAKARVSKEDRASARTARRAEAARAQKSGEIKAKGEASY